MIGLVVDASAVGLNSSLVEDADSLYAPEVIDLEVANYFRKAVLRRELTDEDAGQAMGAWACNAIQRASHGPLLSTIWELRHNITPYDASYVALAIELGLPLLTADRRLAAAAAGYCEVILAE